MKLEVQNLVRRFGNALALDGASLDANSGEIVALLGPSGCGKTTTLRIVAGFENSDSGHVMLGGEEIGRLPPHKRDIGLVFQDYALFPHMSVADNVAYGLKRRGVSKLERNLTIQKTLETVRLAGLEARRPAQLSGGQQQRVALARALAIRPRLLLLDEPLSNLDAKLRGVLQTELREILTRVGTTTLIVTHDQEEAMALADRVAVMRHGRTLQLGTPRQVYEKPATRFVAEFLGKSLWLEGKLDGERFVTDTGFSLRCAPAYLSAARYGLMLRPEALSVKARLGDGDGFPATVKSVRYRGHAELLELDIAGRLTISIEVPHGAPIPEPGTRVALGFDPARALPVPEDTD